MDPKNPECTQCGYQLADHTYAMQLTQGARGSPKRGHRINLFRCMATTGFKGTPLYRISQRQMQG